MSEETTITTKNNEQKKNQERSCKSAMFSFLFASFALKLIVVFNHNSQPDFLMCLYMVS